MDIPNGNDREEIRSRWQLLKDFYAKWNEAHPGKRVWNKSLGAYIHVKYVSINETARQASISFESTQEVLRLSEILSEAELIKAMPPKRGNKNQKPFSEILVMKQKSAMLIVGKQRSTEEYVQYCISCRHKK